MKTRILSALSLMLVLLCSCETKYDDSAVKGQIDSNSSKLTSLENRVEALNKDINNIRDLLMALQQNVYIYNVREIDGAWRVTFTDGTTMTINRPKAGEDGKNAKDAAALGIAEYEGIYYWTITNNGSTTWLLDPLGNKIRVTGESGTQGKDAGPGAPGREGVTPKLRVDAQGFWEVSYNNGISYEPLYDAEGNRIYALPGGGNPDTFFTEITETDDYVIFRMFNGSEIKLPKIKDFFMTFSQNKDIGISDKSSTQITFYVEGPTSDTYVACHSHENLKAEVVYKRGDYSGVIKVRQTGPMVGSNKMNVLLCNSKTTIMYTLTFAPHSYYWDIPDDGGKIPDQGGNEPGGVIIPTPGSPTVDVDGDHNVLSVVLTGIQKTDGSWLELFGTGDPRQNIWVEIDGVSKGFIVESLTQTSAKADLVFLVDNSGTMSEESNAIARDISAWANQLSAKNLDIKFGLVGYDGCIHGAINMTDAASLNAYLNRSGLNGTSRTMGFAGPDATALQNAAKSYPANCQLECGGVALRYADRLFSFRSGSNRVYVNFTDEPNQPFGNSEYSVEYVRNPNNWPMGRGTIHTVFSENPNYCGDEKPWLFSDYTGGTTIFTDSSFSGVNLSSLPVTESLVHTVILRMLLPDYWLGGTHTLRLVVWDPSGTYYKVATFYNVVFVRS